MKFLIAVLALSFSVSALAQTQLRSRKQFEKPLSKTSYEVFLLNAQGRFEVGEDQELTPRQTLNVGFGAQSQGYGFLAELSSYNTETGGDYAGVDRAHREAVLWIRKDFGGWTKFRWLGGLGAGLSSEEITTRLDGLQITDTSRTEPLGAISFGGQLTFENTLRLSLEGRVFHGLGASPMPDILLRTGIVF